MPAAEFVKLCSALRRFVFMQRWHAFCQLILARIREFYREPETIFWVYGFPLLLAAGLGVAFARSQPEPPTVDVQEIPGSNQAHVVAEQLKRHDCKVEIHAAEKCQARLIQGRTNVVVVPGDEVELKFDEARAESLLDRNRVELALLRDKVGSSVMPVRETKQSEPGSRYIDFLLPGLIGMNIMGGGLFGVGFVLVDMRAKKLFKRLLATPMRRGDFLLSLLTSRLLFLAPEMLSLLLMGQLAFSIPMRGSVFCLLAVILLGALAFAGIGLLVGSRTDKTETISGLINLVMLPMYLLSGIFFSSTKFPKAAQPFIQALPLTQLNDALREVMLEGASWNDVAWRLGILALWGAGTFFLALRWFRWR
jgi:ABC-2 type transport system permease protein